MEEEKVLDCKNLDVFGKCDFYYIGDGIPDNCDNKGKCTKEDNECNGYNQ